MSIFALFAWIIAACGGLYLLAVWLIEYDREFQGAAASRLPVPVIAAHALLAVGGLVLWGINLVLQNVKLAWTAFGVLVVVASLGLVMAVRWIYMFRATTEARRAAVAGSPSAHGAELLLLLPPERNFPVSVVIGHGVLAVTTLVLVLLTALGGS